jgi:hypothetical protein
MPGATNETVRSRNTVATICRRMVSFVDKNPDCCHEAGVKTASILAQQRHSSSKELVAHHLLHLDTEAVTLPRQSSLPLEGCHMKQILNVVARAVAASGVLAGAAMAQAPIPVTVTPEPSTYVLLGTGAVALGLVARARRNKK